MITLHYSPNHILLVNMPHLYQAVCHYHTIKLYVYQATLTLQSCMLAGPPIGLGEYLRKVLSLLYNHLEPIP